MKLISNPFIKLSALIILCINFQVQSSETSAWGYEERIDLMTDEDTSYASATQLNCLKNCGEIIVRADGAVLIHFGKFMESKNDIKLDYRFDKEEIKTMNLSVSTKGTSGFLKKNDRNVFVAKLMHYDTVVLRGYNFRGTSLTFKIPLKNSKESIVKVSKFSSVKSFVEIQKDHELALNKVLKEELGQLKYALNAIEKTSGKNSEAYKIIKVEYENKKAEMDFN
jgi:hypothetical protein